MKADWQPTEEVGEAPGSQGMEAVVGEQEDVFSKAQLGGSCLLWMQWNIQHRPCSSHGSTPLREKDKAFTCGNKQAWSVAGSKLQKALKMQNAFTSSD